jgi:hypothetical protein
MNPATKVLSSIANAAVCGSAGLTSPTPTGIPAPQIRAPADSLSLPAIREALAIVQRHLRAVLTPFRPSVSVEVDGERCVQSHYNADN